MFHTFPSARSSSADKRMVTFMEAFGEAFPHLSIPAHDSGAPHRLRLRHIGQSAIVRMSSPMPGYAAPSSLASSIHRGGKVKLLWQLSGSTTFSGTGLSLKVAAGQAAIIPEQIPHEVRLSADHSILTTAFDASEFLEWQFLVERQNGRPLTMNSAMKASASAIRTIASSIDAGASDKLAVKSAIDLFFRSIPLEHDADSIFFQRLSHRLERAKMAVMKNISNFEYTPDQLARDVGLSKRSLYLEFEQYGLTPGSFIRDLRLFTSRHDIVSRIADDLTLTEIAFRNGFSDSSQFSRAFRARYGTSPSQLRSIA